MPSSVSRTLFFWLKSSITLALVFYSCSTLVRAQQISVVQKKQSSNTSSKKTSVEHNETSKPEKPAPSQLSFTFPPPPDNFWAPGQRRSEGGSRGSCQLGKLASNSNTNNSVTALVPAWGSGDNQKVLGLTSESSPKFWFYIPYTTPTPAEFVLQTRKNQTLYRANIPISGRPGVVGVSLPSSVPLKIGSSYHWYFKIYCEPEQPPVFVNGWIHRENPSLALRSKTSAAKPKSRVILFANQGFWYDAITASALAHRTDPKDTTWSTLLGAIRLNEISREPIKTSPPEEKVFSRSSAPISY